MYTKFEMILTYGDKVTLRTRNALKNQRGIIKKRNKVELRFLCSAPRVIARNMHTKFGMFWTYSDKVMLQIRKSGAAAANAATADESNPYMSPSQATQ